MATHRPKKNPLKTYNPHILYLIVAQKGLEGVWGNLSSKGSPKKAPPDFQKFRGTNFGGKGL